MSTPHELARRAERLKSELAQLQTEVENLGHFFGAFHAVNGLRQAQTYVNDCLWRLDDLSEEKN